MKSATTSVVRRGRIRRRLSAALGAVVGVALLAGGQPQPAQAAGPTGTQTTLTTSKNPSSFGEYVTLTGTVFPTGGSVPTGSVSFDEKLLGGVVTQHLGDAPLVAAGPNGQASFAINTLSVGSHTVVASYGGDAANSASTSTSLVQIVNQASTATTLASSKNPSTSGDSVTFTAGVTSAGGIPTGTVNFNDGATLLGSGALDGTGAASFSTTGLSLGTHTVTASYGGDTSFKVSSSASVSQLVRAPSTTVLTAAPNPSTYGATVTLTATVTGSNGTATGSVTFRDGVNAIGSPVSLDNTGKATLASTTLTTGGHSLTAVYGGDGTYSASTSTASTQGVQQATPTVALSASANPSPFGIQLDLTTAVTGPAGANVAPSGTVTVKDGTTVVGTGTISAGHATVSIATLAVGSHSLTAAYSGDVNYVSGSPGTLTETVSKAATITVVSASPSPGVLSQAVTLTATVTGNGGTPSGTVTFKDGTTVLGSGAVALDIHGKATLSTSALAAGAHSLTGVYTGDGTYLTSTSAAASETVLDLTTTTVSSSAAGNTSAFGQSVSITATVAASTLGATPTGTVTFMDGATALGSPVNLDAGGKATYTSSALAVSAHSITAVYSGDAAFNISTSAVLTETVTKASTTTTLQSSATGNSSVFGQEVDLTATVTPANGGSPSGSVTFMDGTTAVTGSPVSLSGGKAVLKISTLAVGPHSLTASYSGDASFLSSTSSPAVPLTVVQATTSTTLTSDLATPIHGQSVTLTATVTWPAGTPATPTGTVTFNDGGSALSSPVAIDSSGTATLTTAGLAGGGHSLSAVYSGDTSYTTSTGTVSLTVAPQATSTLLTSSPNPSQHGQGVTLTATVSGAGATGTVTFKDGTTTLGSQPLGGGTATLTPAFAALGTHSLTAAYSGDASFSPSTSSATSQQVVQAGSTTTLSSDTNPSTYGGSLTLTATVAAKAPGVGTPTGTVTFKDGATALGSAVTLDAGGKATYTSSALTAGTHTITAVYAGDTNFVTSTSAGLTQTVNQAGTTTAVTSPTGGGSSAYGAPVTLTATVSGSGATGSVTFQNGATAIAGPVTLTAGHASIAVSSLAAASYSITAVYSGDANYTTSTSAAVTYTITKGTSGTSLAASPSAPIFGQAVTFTATLSGAGGGSYGGTVTFTEGTTVLSGPVAPSGGTATFATSALAVGSHTVTATYGADANLTGSSSPVTLAEGKASTSTTVASSANPSAEGQVTYTATIAVTSPGAGIPGGFAGFSDGGSAIAGCGAQAVSAAKASCTVTYTSPSSPRITAAYAGDGSFNASTSATLNQTVTGPAGVSVTLQSHAMAANGAATTQVRAQLKDTQGNNLAYAGDTVTFTSNGGLSFTDAGGAGNTNSAVTDATGLATVKVVASKHAGTVIITATTADSPALVATDHLKLTGSHFGATSLSQNRIAADGNSTTVATAQVVDGEGNPVSGETVGFSSPGASVAQPTVVTDGNGNASDTLTSSTTPGTQPVTIADGNFADNPSTSLALTLLPALGPSNASFIHNAYVTLLGRDVDPGGFSYWLGALNGGMPRKTLASFLANSGEYRQDVIGGSLGIQGFYLQYLGRPSDQAGVDYWVSQMAGGVTFEHVRLAFIGSPEYFTHHNSDPSQTIDALYNDVLHRSDATDPYGKAYWLTHFNVNTIAAQFLYSYEGRATLVNSYYNSILNRGNDAAGLSFWTQAILGGASDENVIADFLSSQEYFLSH